MKKKRQEGHQLSQKAHTEGRLGIDSEPLYKYADADVTAFLYESVDHCGVINAIDCVWDKEKILNYACEFIDLADCDSMRKGKIGTITELMKRKF